MQCFEGTYFNTNYNIYLKPNQGVFSYKLKIN